MSRPEDVPAQLGRLQLGLTVGEECTVDLRVLPADRVDDVVHGAGFTTVSADRSRRRVVLRRERTLPDTVGAGMRVLLVSLNPSIYAADAGIGFARPGNRFWPSMLASGLATVDRDQWHLLEHHRIGMTELAKRATVRSDELDVEEYRHGVARVERLVRWLQPLRVCVVGLDGWRKVIDRRATTGWQPRHLGDAPTYVMPNPSGLNARATLTVLVDHLRSAALAELPSVHGCSPGS